MENVLAYLHTWVLVSLRACNLLVFMCVFSINYNTLLHTIPKIIYLYYLYNTLVLLDFI